MVFLLQVIETLRPPRELIQQIAEDSKYCIMPFQQSKMETHIAPLKLGTMCRAQIRLTPFFIWISPRLLNNDVMH